MNVTSKSGIPLSLDKEEYEFVNRDEAVHAIDAYSYGLGAMDCFCEMVSAGLKTLAMSHPLRYQGGTGFLPAGCRKAVQEVRGEALSGGRGFYYGFIPRGVE